MLTKSQAAARIASGQSRETFMHDTLGLFDVTEIRHAIEQLTKVKPSIKPLRCRFDAVRAWSPECTNPHEWLFSQREIDEARVAELTPEQIEDPLIYLDCPAGVNGDVRTTLLVDGIHRYVRRYRDGMEDFAYWLVPIDVAPRVPEGMEFINLPWGEKEVIPGRGLVDRKK